MVDPIALLTLVESGLNLSIQASKHDWQMRWPKRAAMLWGRAVGEALEHTAADSAAVPLETTGTSLHQSRLTSYPIYPNAN
jgi:hypothetical protein